MVINHQARHLPLPEPDEPASGSMAGPPLVPSSSTNMNTNVQKEDKREDQPFPKRRRKSIDDDVPDGTSSTTAATEAAGALQDGEC